VFSEIVERISIGYRVPVDHSFPSSFCLHSVGYSRPIASFPSMTLDSGLLKIFYLPIEPFV